MKRLAIINQKGGAGKTTTAVNLSAALGEQKKRTLLVDLDAQRSASVWCGVRSEGNAERNLMRALIGKSDIGDIIVRDVMPGVDLVPATAELLGAEGYFAAEGSGSEYGLADQLTALDHDWDYVILDCPPELKKITQAAMLAASELLIVARPGMLDLEGIKMLTVNVTRVQQRLNKELQVFGVLLCQATPRTRVYQRCRALLDQAFPGKVFDSVVRPCIRFSECPGHAKPITVYAPMSAGAADYRAVAAEFLEREATNGRQ